MKLWVTYDASFSLHLHDRYFQLKQENIVDIYDIIYFC